jgi:Predicted dithiol-disulfide isomerase involved in polyketide biosynthesis
MINVWEGVGSHAEAAAFCDMWGIHGTVLVDEPGDYVRALGIRGVPTNVFVDADGTVTAVGAVAPAQFEAEIRRLLGPDAPIDPA